MTIERIRYNVDDGGKYASTNTQPDVAKGKEKESCGCHVHFVRREISVGIFRGQMKLFGNVCSIIGIEVRCLRRTSITTSVICVMKLGCGACTSQLSLVSKKLCCSQNSCAIHTHCNISLRNCPPLPLPLNKNPALLSGKQRDFDRELRRHNNHFSGHHRSALAGTFLSQF